MEKKYRKKELNQKEKGLIDHTNKSKIKLMSQDKMKKVFKKLRKLLHIITAFNIKLSSVILKIPFPIFKRKIVINISDNFLLINFSNEMGGDRSKQILQGRKEPRILMCLERK